jgi:AcrR family transcriptional regulator
MSDSERSSTSSSGSGGLNPGEGGSRREARFEELIEERIQQVIARGEERLRREYIAHEAEIQRARERVERELERAQAKLDRAQAKLEAQDQRVRDGRARIIAAARELFLDRGYLATSMQEIAEAADLRKASIYHHFADKEALFAAIVLEEFDASWGRLSAIIARDQPLAETLRAIAEQQFEINGTEVGRLLFDFRKFVPETRHEEVHAKLQQMIDANAALFQRAIDRGEIIPIDPRLAALFFFHMGAAWTFHGMEDPSILPPDPASGAKTLVDVFLHGLAARITPAT